MSPILLQTIARTIGPVLLLFSLVLLLRGHNRPGGGFVGGLMAASALTLYLTAYGLEATTRALKVSPERIAAAGLLLSVGSGSLALLDGRPFLAGYWTAVTLPGRAEVEAGTPLLFDTGVYLVVLGATLTFVLYLKGK
jgi:multicomponent Na+:H+ antiporter subunit B